MYLSVLFLLFFFYQHVHATTTTVVLSSGASIVGSVNDLNGVKSFYRIQYATAGRFQRSVPVVYGSGAVVNATDNISPTPVCPQPVPPGPPPNQVNVEQCLFANIQVPSTATTTSLKPVIVFIHGGSFVVGTGLNIDATQIVTENDVVFVSFNYRLGLLGFASLPGVLSDGSSGNYGLLDQRVLLRWVQSNIQQFGGDPTKVTLMGQSSGADAVCFHLATTTTAKNVTFSNAIVESSSCQTAFTLQQATSLTVSALSTTACNVTSFPISAVDTAAFFLCLSQLDPNTLVNSVSTSAVQQYFGTIDGVILKDTYTNTIATGAGALVPTLAYTNKDEFGLFLCGPPLFGNLNSSQFPGALTPLLNGNVSEAAAVQSAYATLYPNLTSFQTFVAIQSDALMHCETRTVLDSIALGAAARGVPRPPLFFIEMEYVPSYSNTCMGACHIMELVLLFTNYLPNTPFPAPPVNYSMPVSEQTLGQNLRALWSSFAKGGVSGNALTSAAYNVPDYCADYLASSSSSSSCAGNYLRILSPSVNVTSLGTGYNVAACSIWEADNGKLISDIIAADAVLILPPPPPPVTTPVTSTPVTTTTPPVTPTVTPTTASTTTTTTCPSTFPFECIQSWNASVCFNDQNSATACSGPINSWCSLSNSIPVINNFISQGYGIYCNSVAGIVCPRSYPFLSASLKVCFNTASYANSNEGPVNSWCALPSSSSTIFSFVQSGYGVNCNITQASLCPSGFPFLSGACYNSAVCYNQPSFATSCNGPVGSWCALSGAPSLITGFVSQGYGKNC